MFDKEAEKELNGKEFNAYVHSVYASFYEISFLCKNIGTEQSAVSTSPIFY